MSKNINELAEIVLDRVYKLGYQHRIDIEEHCLAADELIAVERNLREAEQELQRLRKVHLESQSEEVAAALAVIETLRQERDLARAEVETRRKELDTLTHLSQAEFETLRKERDHWMQARQDAHEAGELLLKCTQTLQAEIDTLRQQLADAQREASDEFIERQVLTAEQQEGEAAWRKQLDAAQAEIETLKGAMAADDKRLRDAEEKVWPGATWGCDAPDKMADRILLLRHCLGAAHEALKRARLEEDEQGQELERLRAFVKVMRGLLPEEYADQRIIAEALAELDAGTSEPAPVTEPLNAEGGA